MKKHASVPDDRHPAVWKGAVAGLAGGLAASWAMNQFQLQLSKRSSQPAPEEADDATMKTAAAISERIAHYELTNRQKKAAGPALHYAFGSTMGAVYGAMTEKVPAASKGWGLPFGTALWLGADEVAVPVLGLAGKPTDTPLSTHAYALASHLVYGLTADAVRRAVRAAL